jgi:hypothetical protein
MGARSGASAAVALCVLATAAPAAAAERVIGRAARPTAVSAHGGLAVWSGWSERAQRYRLVAWSRGGGRRVLPVRGQRVPFDADVGPGPSGRPVVVYSRCRRPPDLGRSSTELPTYVSGRGCDLYLYDPRTRREREIAARSLPGTSEMLPSVWGKRIAFARVYEKRSAPQSVYPHLYYGSLTSRSYPYRLPGGTRGVYEKFDSTYYDGGPGPVGIDFDGRRVAYTWNGQAESCRAGDEGDLDHLRSEVWVDTLAAGDEPEVRHELVEDTCEGETDHFFSPSLGGERLFYYRRLNTTSFDGRFRAAELGGGGFAESAANPKGIALARDGEVTYFSRFLKYGGRTEIVRSTDLAFAPSERSRNR